MRFIIFSLTCSLLFNTGIAQNADASKPVTGINISQRTADSLFNLMLGEWKIQSRFWDPETKRMDTITGKAKWEKTLNDQYIKEHFELNFFFDQILKGDGYLRYSPVYDRFEFIQLDEFSVSSLLLIGKWDAKNKILAFRPPADYAQWGDKKPLQVEWDYHFYKDGSFRKEMRFPDEKGNFVFASDYHYIK